MVLVSLCLSGCSRRPGLNFECEWVPDTTFAADLRDDAHVGHLLDDIRTAEELDIRYRDRLAGYRLVETFGIVSRHGRQKTAPAQDGTVPAPGACLATLFQDVASSHGLTVSDIKALRSRLADRGLDLPVTIPVTFLLVLSLTRFIRWARQRFESDEWLAWLVASLAGSLLIPVLVLTMGWLWAMLVEVVRVGNEHVSYRARMDSLQANFLVLLGLGIVSALAGSAASAFRRQASAR